jgi:hypothetical protein
VAQLSKLQNAQDFKSESEFQHGPSEPATDPSHGHAALSWHLVTDSELDLKLPQSKTGPRPEPRRGFQHHSE